MADIAPSRSRSVLDGLSDKQKLKVYEWMDSFRLSLDELFLWRERRHLFPKAQCHTPPCQGIPDFICRDIYELKEFCLRICSLAKKFTLATITERLLKVFTEEDLARWILIHSHLMKPFPYLENIPQQMLNLDICIVSVKSKPPAVRIKKEPPSADVEEAPPQQSGVSPRPEASPTRNIRVNPLTDSTVRLLPAITGTAGPRDNVSDVAGPPPSSSATTVPSTPSGSFVKSSPAQTPRTATEVCTTIPACSPSTRAPIDSSAETISNVKKRGRPRKNPLPEPGLGRPRISEISKKRSHLPSNSPQAKRLAIASPAESPAPPIKSPTASDLTRSNNQLQQISSVARSPSIGRSASKENHPELTSPKQLLPPYHWTKAKPEFNAIISMYLENFPVNPYEFKQWLKTRKVVLDNLYVREQLAMVDVFIVFIAGLVKDADLFKLKSTSICHEISLTSLLRWSRDRRALLVDKTAIKYQMLGDRLSQIDVFSVEELGKDLGIRVKDFPPSQRHRFVDLPPLSEDQSVELVLRVLGFYQYHPKALSSLPLPINKTIKPYQRLSKVQKMLFDIRTIIDENLRLRTKSSAPFASLTEEENGEYGELLNDLYGVSINDVVSLATQDDSDLRSTSLNLPNTEDPRDDFAARPADSKVEGKDPDAIFREEIRRALRTYF